MFVGGISRKPGREHVRQKGNRTAPLVELINGRVPALAIMDPAIDRGAKLIARNRELLARARETREQTREAAASAEHSVRHVMRTRIARELSRQPPGKGERRD